MRVLQVSQQRAQSSLTRLTFELCFSPEVNPASQGESPLVTADISKQPQLKRYQLYRGLYSRVARKLGVDRSYVSRVARGERRSPEIETALQVELKRIDRL
jgi:transcriptional regulator with XRE-family HTH domain